MSGSKGFPTHANAFAIGFSAAFFLVSLVEAMPVLTLICVVVGALNMAFIIKWWREQ